MLGIWGDSDSSSLDKKEEASNFCLMANENEVNSENSFHLTFNKLFEAFNDLMHKFKKLRLKNKESRKSNLSLTEEKNKNLNKKKII